MNIRSVLVRGFFLVALLASCFYLAYGNDHRPVVPIARNVAWNDFISQIKFLPEDSPQDSLDKENPRDRGDRRNLRSRSVQGD